MKFIIFGIFCMFLGCFFVYFWGVGLVLIIYGWYKCCKNKKNEK